MRLVAQRPAALRIGTADGSEAEQFYRIRGVVRLEDGSIVVGDGGSSQLRFFDPHGKHIRSAGRAGSGPGEFRELLWLSGTAADTLVAWDVGSRRIVVYDRHGNFARSYAVPADPEFPLAVPEQVYPDGSILSLAGPPREEADSAGKGYWSVIALRHTASDGADLGRVAVVRQQRCPEPGCARRMSGYRAVWATAETGVYYHEPGHAGLVRFGVGDRVELAFSDLQTPSDTVSPITDLRVDRNGLLWMRRTSGLWIAYGLDGERRIEATVPSDVRVYEITSTYVLGVSRDEFGVEYVELLDLEPR